MNLYLVHQNANDGYDTYDSAIIAADTESDAKMLHPNDERVWLDGAWRYKDQSRTNPYYDDSWTLPQFVTAELIGVAKDGTVAGVILASFNAG